MSSADEALEYDLTYVPYGRQSIDDSDIEAVVEVLRSDFLTQGPVVEKFEQRICEAVDAPYCLSVNSATSALHIACLALGVGPGDLVWTSPISFVASSNCALYCGADVDFVDIDRETFNICVRKLKEKLEQAALEKRLPKVVIPVHLCGLPCDMDEIWALAKQYGFHVIEDASHAIGATYKGRPIGSCTHSDIAVFSFHPVKIITTAEGGCATTRNPELAHAMSLLRSHGITRDQSRMTKPSDGPWYYQQIELGFNYRMTELQAALGYSQLKRLSDFVGLRHELADRYRKLLKDLPITLPVESAESYSALHLFVIQLQTERLQQTHHDIFVQLREKNIGVNLHYIPIYTQPYYKKLGFLDGYCPEAERYYERSISIPIYHGMTYDQQDRVVAALQAVLQ